MKDTFRPAIDALLSKLADLEQRVAEAKRAINTLCELGGGVPMFAETESARGAGAALRSDQFYGKVMTTAAREYLEIRKASNRGPASPREIYEALVEGGFKFDTKSEINAMTGLRQTLRKNSSTFHKLPNGQYGLLAWYPNAKAAKSDDESDEEEGPAAPTPPKRKPRSKANGTGHGAVSDASKAAIRKFLLDGLPEGSGVSLKTITGMAEGLNLSAEGMSLSRALHVTLLGLKSQKLVTHGADGWRKAVPKAE